MALPMMANDMAQKQAKMRFSFGDIGNAIGGAVSDTANAVAKPFTDIAQGQINPGSILGGAAAHVGGILPALGDNLYGSGPDAPPVPGTPGALDQLKQAQINTAKDFRQNLPGMEGQLGNQLASSSNQQLGQDTSSLKQMNSRRGLLYGGVNAGGENKLRASAQGGLSAAKSQLHAGLESQANQLDSEAIQTGVAIQQSQQQMQNLIYQQALARMQSENAMMGSLFQAGGMAAGMALA